MKSLLLWLPQEIVAEIIFQGLQVNIEAGYKINLFRVCKGWRNILNTNPLLWKQVYTNLGWTYTKNSNWSDVIRRKSVRLESGNAKEIFQSCLPVGLECYFKYTEHGWNVVQLSPLGEEIDAKIRLGFSRRENTCIIKLTQVNPVNILYNCEVWYKGTWKSLEHEVTLVKVWNNYILYTAYSNIGGSTVYVYNLDTMDLVMELGQMYKFLTVIIEDGYLFYATNCFDIEYTIHVIDLRTKTAIQSIKLKEIVKLHDNSQVNIVVWNDYMALSQDSSITTEEISTTVFNWRNKDVLYTVEGYAIAMYNHLLITRHILPEHKLVMRDTLTGDILITGKIFTYAEYQEAFIIDDKHCYITWPNESNDYNRL